MLLLQTGTDLFKQVKRWEITIPMMLLFICLFVVVLVAIILRERVNCPEKRAMRKLGKAHRHPPLTEQEQEDVNNLALEQLAKSKFVDDRRNKTFSEQPLAKLSLPREETIKTSEGQFKYVIPKSEGDYVIEKDADLKGIEKIEQTEPIIETLNKEEPELTESEKQLIAEYKQSMEGTDFIITDKE